jgi:DNA-directed RNA polymerase omega subunit
MMLYPKIEDCIVKAGGCKYTLVAEVAKRAKDLAIHRPAEFGKGKEKEISYAMWEVFNDKLQPVYGATAKK